MKQHYQDAHAQRVSLMSTDYRTSGDVAGPLSSQKSYAKMRNSAQSQHQMSFLPTTNSTNSSGVGPAQQQRFYNSFHLDHDQRPQIQLTSGGVKAPSKSTSIKQFIQLGDQDLSGQQRQPKKSSSLAFDKISDLTARTLLSASKTSKEPAKLPASTSFSTSNYLIKFPSKQDSSSIKSSALLLPPPPQQQVQPSVRASLPHGGENFYDEIDIYENDAFGSRHHLRALYNELRAQEANKQQTTRPSNEMTTSTTSAMSGSSASLLLDNASNRSRNSNSSNLLQQFSSKINCFRSSQRNVQQKFAREANLEADAPCKMKSSMSSSRIVYKSPPSIASTTSSGRARSRVSSRSPTKTIHLYNPCEPTPASPSSSALSTNSSFSRSSMATSSMKSTKSLKLRIKSPFKFGNQSKHQQSSSDKQCQQSNVKSSQVSPSASSGYNSSQDQFEAMSLSSHRSIQEPVLVAGQTSQCHVNKPSSVILSYCSINDDANAKSKYIDLLIQKKQKQQSTMNENALTASTMVLRRTAESPVGSINRLSRQNALRSSYSTSNDLCNHQAIIQDTPKPVPKSVSYSLDENDNLLSPGSNKSISSSSSASSSSSYSASMGGSSAHQQAKTIDPNYMYLSDADSSMDASQYVSSHQQQAKPVELKTSPFPRVNTCFVAQIKPTVDRQRIRPSASSGAIGTSGNKCVELKIEYDEPIYENLNSFKSTKTARPMPATNRNSFGGVIVNPIKTYSVNDVLHSLKNLELANGPAQRKSHLTTIPIVYMNNRDDNECDCDDAEYGNNKVSKQSDEEPTMIIHPSDASKNAMSPATSTSSFSMSDSSSYQYSPKPVGSAASSKPNSQQDLDDELCDEEVEFYLFNSANRDSATCGQYYNEPVQAQGGQYFNSFTKQPIALWEQLV